MSSFGPGERWLHLEAVTPTHLGTESLSSDLESPTVTEPFHGLPFLADSALKGVLAAQLRDRDKAGRASGRSRRGRLFGEPDRFEPGADAPVWGHPGEVVLGNGELLALPLLRAGGGRAWAVPAPALASFCASNQDPQRDAEPAAPAPALLAAVEAGSPAVLAWTVDPATGRALPCAPPRLEVAVPWETPVPGPRSAALVHEGLPELARRVEALTGGSLDPTEPRLLASAATLGRLWTLGADRRTSTALEEGTKTVTPGALRRVERIPVGTLFLARLTLTRPVEDLELPPSLQVGSGESTGQGTVRLSLLDAAPVAASPTQDPAPESPPPEPQELGRKNAAAPPPPPEEDRVMVEVLHRVRAAAATAETPVLQATRSAIRNLGPRIQISGLEGALAFSLAKARAEEPRPSAEQRAHRVIAAAALGLDGEEAATRGPFPALAATLAEGFPSPDPKTLEWLALWLRRTAELGLRTATAMPSETDEGGAAP